MRGTRNPKFVQIYRNRTSGQVCEIFLTFSPGLAYLKWPVVGFWRKMAQNTRNEARMCLFGSERWSATFRGSNSPKTATNRQNIGHLMREVDDNEEWRHRRMTSIRHVAFVVVSASYKAKQRATVLQPVTSDVLVVWLVLVTVACSQWLKSNELQNSQVRNYQYIRVILAHISNCHVWPAFLSYPITNQKLLLLGFRYMFNYY